jgi:hypothetical protein
LKTEMREGRRCVVCWHLHEGCNHAAVMIRYSARFLAVSGLTFEVEC